MFHFVPRRHIWKHVDRHFCRRYNSWHEQSPCWPAWQMKRPPGNNTVVWLTFLLWLCPRSVFAIGETPFVSSQSSAGAFPLAANGSVPSIYTDTNDFWGVTHAAADLQKDIQRVTGVTPTFMHDEKQPGTNAIIIGTLGKSRLVDQLARAGASLPARLPGNGNRFHPGRAASPARCGKRAWSLAGATSAGRFTASTICPKKWAFRPGIGGRTCRCAHQDAAVRQGREVRARPACRQISRHLPERRGARI